MQEQKTDTLMDGRHSRTERLLGKEAVEKLWKSKVAVIGLGGVGSYVAEALARAGVGRFLLLDSDRIAESNINRQATATYDTIGKPKTEVAAQRIFSINPKAQVDCYQMFLGKDTIDDVDFSGCHYIADAIDNISAKILLVEKAVQLGIPIISSMGTGNKLNPMAFQVADISKTCVCPLARVMRRELKKRGFEKLDVVFSTEQPITTVDMKEETEKNGGKPIPASISFVPSAAGLLMASHIVKKMILC